MAATASYSSSSRRPRVQSGGRASYVQPSRARSSWSKPGPSPVRAAETTAGSVLSFEEIKGDLFECPEGFSLAHCVSEDLAMGKGIATLFKEKFRGVRELKDQGVRPGGVAYLKRNERFIYYLVTKKRCFHKPTMDSLKSSLIAMRKHCISNEVTCLAMPRIGSGLDRLDWDKVRNLIQEVFGYLNMTIVVYYL